MKLIYLTSQAYPSGKVDPVFWSSMAKAFTGLLDGDFVFLVRGHIPDVLRGINTLSTKAPKRFKTVFYFFWLPINIIVRRWYTRGTVFFSADAYLLSIVIFWRQIFRFKYTVCSDWHQMFDDWRDTYVAGHSDFLITTSQRLKSLIVSKCGVSADTVLVAYGGIDPAPFTEQSSISKEEHRRRLGLPTDMFLVGYVGGFRSVGLEKGLSTMIGALPDLDKKIHMVFVGGSEQHIEAYKKEAEDLNVEQQCIFVKKQPFEKVVAYELAMDALVIPYPDTHHFRDYGFPLKVWEYMASGRPIIYSDLEIIREVLEGRGVSFRPDDSADLVRAVRAVRQDGSLFERNAKENQVHVRSYTWVERARHIVDFIRT